MDRYERTQKFLLIFLAFAYLYRPTIGGQVVERPGKRPQRQDVKDIVFNPDEASSESVKSFSKIALNWIQYYQALSLVTNMIAFIKFILKEFYHLSKPASCYIPGPLIAGPFGPISYIPMLWAALNISWRIRRRLTPEPLYLDSASFAMLNHKIIHDNHEQALACKLDYNFRRRLIDHEHIKQKEVLSYYPVISFRRDTSRLRPNGTKAAIDQLTNSFNEAATLAIICVYLFFCNFSYLSASLMVTM